MSTLTRSRRILYGASVFALTGMAFSCGGTEHAAAPGTAKPAAEAPLIPADAEAIPTPDEAAAEAAARIHEENADAELEKLKKELGDG